MHRGAQLYGSIVENPVCDEQIIYHEINIKNVNKYKERKCSLSCYCGICIGRCIRILLCKVDLCSLLMCACLACFSDIEYGRFAGVVRRRKLCLFSE